jgi:hypothetical protein
VPDEAFDRFDLATGRLSVASATLPVDVPETAWINATFPPRYTGPEGLCAGRSTGMPGAGTQSWFVRVAGERTWRMRQGCGFIEALHIAESEAWIFELKAREPFDVSAPSEPGREFTSFIDSVVLARTEAQPTFSSARFEYTIRYPGIWELFPATETWTGGDWPRGHDTDVFAGPVSVMSVYSTPVPDPNRFEAWLRTTFPTVPNACRDGRPWVAMQAGEVAFERTWCGVRMQAILADGRAYLTSISAALEGGEEALTGGAYELTLGTEAVASPADPANDLTSAFRSDGYGYSLRFPSDWQAIPATTTWTATERPWAPAADTFAAGGYKGVFVVASAKLAAGADPIAVLDEAMPSRRHGGGGPCLMHAGRGFDPLRPDPWRPVEIAGHLGYARESCGFVDRVVTVEGRAYAFVLRGSRRSNGATPDDIALADAIIATVEFRPGDATAP